MRLSMPESAAMGASGIDSDTIPSVSSLTSMPPSFTRSSCLSAPVTVMKEPCARPEIASVIASFAAEASSPSTASRTAGFTSCTAPDSSRRTTNCTFF